jgi:hypothetical protein
MLYVAVPWCTFLADNWFKIFSFFNADIDTMEKLKAKVMQKSKKLAKSLEKEEELMGFKAFNVSSDELKELLERISPQLDDGPDKEMVNRMLDSANKAFCLDCSKESIYRHSMALALRLENSIALYDEIENGGSYYAG